MSLKEDFVRVYTVAQQYVDVSLSGGGRVPAMLFLASEYDESKKAMEIVGIPVDGFMNEEAGKNALAAMIDAALDGVLPSHILEKIGKPPVICMTSESWLVLRNSKDDIKGVIASEQPDRIEAVVYILRSPDYETMAYSRLIREEGSVRTEKVPLEFNYTAETGGRFTPGRLRH